MKGDGENDNQIEEEKGKENKILDWREWWERKQNSLSLFW